MPKIRHTYGYICYTHMPKSVKYTCMPRYTQMPLYTQMANASSSFGLFPRHGLSSSTLQYRRGPEKGGSKYGTTDLK